MALNLVLSRYDFNPEEIGRAVTYIVYTEALAAFDGSTYTTVTVEVADHDKEIQMDVTGGSIAANGTGSFTFVATDTPAFKGLGFLRLKLEKTNTLIYTKWVRILLYGKDFDGYVPDTI